MSDLHSSLNPSSLVEINFDGLLGPSHHYGGLGVGNLASIENIHRTSHPRAGALQGLSKMAAVAELGVPQFILPPCVRPNTDWLRRLGFFGSVAEILQQAADCDPAILSAAYSSAFMWTANAATVTPGIDSNYRQLQITPANLASNLHRQQESDQRLQQLRTIFASVPNSIVHEPLPSSFPLRDEGAANHMRLGRYDRGGIHVYVDGDAPQPDTPNRFLSRHGRRASRAIARQHRLADERTFFLHQHPTAIAAGVFHNDVIATSHEHMLIHHEFAFFDADDTLQQIEAAFEQQFRRDLIRIVVTESELTLQETVESYLFNSQIVTLADGTFVIICPENCQHVDAAQRLIHRWVSDNANPISRSIFLPLEQSMANGGGPACLRLRMQVSGDQLAAIPSAYRITQKAVDRIAEWIETTYPEQLTFSDLLDPVFAEHCGTIRFPF